MTPEQAAAREQTVPREHAGPETFAEARASGTDRAERSTRGRIARLILENGPATAAGLSPAWA